MAPTKATTIISHNTSHHLPRTTRALVVEQTIIPCMRHWSSQQAPTVVDPKGIWATDKNLLHMEFAAHFWFGWFLLFYYCFLFDSAAFEWTDSILEMSVTHSLGVIFINAPAYPILPIFVLNLYCLSPTPTPLLLSFVLIISLIVLLPVVVCQKSISHIRLKNWFLQLISLLDCCYVPFWINVYSLLLWLWWHIPSYGGSR